MYQTLTKNDYQKMLGLDGNYEITALLTCGHYDLEKQVARLQESLNTLKVDHTLKRLNGFLQDIVEFEVDHKKYWFAKVYGGVTLSEYVHLACLFGSQKNIHIGSCGGLNPEMNSLDFLIPTLSYGNESSTRLYDRENEENIHKSNIELNNQIKSKLGIEKVWEGPMMTCGAMLAETKQDVEKWSKEGYYGVEMETSTVFAVSNHFKVPSASLVYVTDNLIKGQVVGDESHNQQKELRYQKAQKMYDVVLSILLF
jgi:purine-nucleoside phosphorylase